MNYDILRENEKFDKFKREIDVNFISQIQASKVFLPLVLKSKGSAIVNVSSGLAIVPKKSAPIYCATKAAVNIFSRTLRYQLENTNCKVFTVFPSLVETNMTKNRQTKMKSKPQYVAKKVVESMLRDNFEIYVGIIKILIFLHRIFPGLAYKILKSG